MIVKLLTEHHFEFLSLKGGCRGSSESTLVKMSNCWNSHAAAHIIYDCCIKCLPILAGAARYQSVLQDIRPRIIVVEEAAEVSFLFQLSSSALRDFGSDL